MNLPRRHTPKPDRDRQPFLEITGPGWMAPRTRFGTPEAVALWTALSPRQVSL